MLNIIYNRKIHYLLNITLIRFQMNEIYLFTVPGALYGIGEEKGGIPLHWLRQTDKAEEILSIAIEKVGKFQALK